MTTFVRKGFWRNSNGELIPVKPGPPKPNLERCAHCSDVAVAGRTAPSGEHESLCARCYKITIGAL